MDLKISLWQKIKLGVAFLFGDGTTLLMWVVDWFNASVLQKIRDPEEADVHRKDMKDFALFLRSVLARRSGRMTEAKRKAFLAVIDAVDCLADALEDLKVTKEELARLVGHVRGAIRAWKEV